MGLFDIFKKKPPTHEEKVDLAYRCYKPEMVGMVFPGGKKQASNIICSIAKLVGKNLADLDAKGYYELLSIYSDVLIRRVVTHSTDDTIVASLQSKHGQEIKSKAVAQKVLAYCTINMQNHGFCLDNAESIEALNLFDNILSQNEQISQSNSVAQTENLDDPEYGLIPEKPVYVKGVEGSDKYLKSLRTVLGENITWERRGSISVDGINGMIDIYDISLHSGKAYKTLYLNMYGTQDSTIAPKGFSIKPIDFIEDILTPQKAATDVIPHLNENLHQILVMNYIAYKKNGHITTADLGRGLDYHGMKEFEEYLVALANCTSSSHKKDCLRLAEEVLCPPSTFEEGAVIFAFASKLKRGTFSKKDVEDFETFVTGKLNEGKEKDFSVLDQQTQPPKYICPSGGVTTKEIADFDKALKQQLVVTSIQAGFASWFRKYPELTIPSLNYSKKLFNGGAGLTALLKLPAAKGNTAQAFAIMCGQALNAGFVAAHIYCQSKGAVASVDTKLNSLNTCQIADEAAHILGYRAGNDLEFINKYSPISIAAADFLAKAKPNQDLFFKCMPLTLTAMFQYGAGLYFE